MGTSQGARREEIRTVVERWRRSLLDADVAAMAELRDDRYTMELPTGVVLSKEEELRLVGDRTEIRMYEVSGVEVTLRPRDAEVTFGYRIEGRVGGVPVSGSDEITLALSDEDGAWRVRRARVHPRAEHQPPATRRLAHRARGLVSRLRARAGGELTSAGHIAYRPGEDFALSRPEPRRAGDLPVPPRELWQGYDDFDAGGAEHTRRMLEIVGDSGVELGSGDRVLDLGCGAGRMIRHLAPLADTSEIWGADISAEHIVWCARHLSPPFHFLTSTTVPHLPFEDRSFRLVYCGSVFTHVDDLARAWLLELARLLTPDGRLYVTIHDEHTLALWERPGARVAPLPRQVLASAARRAAGDSFDMFTVGRGHDAQVFYRRDHFAEMARPVLEPVAAVPEAYGTQTAMLLRRARP